ncbi:MAG: ABC transporter ATP-binding protein [Myxococcota bacterium]
MSWDASVQAHVGSFELDVELEGDRGVLALIGPNGSGKTTFLRLVAGAIAADRAEIRVADRVLSSTRRKVDVPMEKRRLGYVPQGFALFPHLSVIENVAFGLSMGKEKLERPHRRARAEQMLEELGCAPLRDRRVRRLSGGEQQRVALARALVVEPELLLLDEPLAALDASTRRSVRRLLRDRLGASNTPAIVVTHDINDVQTLDATVAVIEGGRIVQRGSVDHLRASPASDFVAEFVGNTDRDLGREAESACPS